MSLDYDSCASIRGKESIYLSVALTMAVVLALSKVILNLIFVERPIASTSLTTHQKSKDAGSMIMKVSTDEVAIILSYLPRPEIMQARVCKTWQHAAEKTIVPKEIKMKTVRRGYSVIDRDRYDEGDFKVDGLMSYYACAVMTTTLPCLQQLTIEHPGNGRTFAVGEDPDEERTAQTANDTVLDINLISNFSKLRTLRLDSMDLNGRYPTLFNFPLLQKLTITYKCHYLKWNLDMLSGCPSLQEFHCNSNLDESISSLRVLKNTLQKVIFSKCSHIHGNFMDLADFPRLKELDLEDTAVTGDIWHIGKDDFPSLVTFRLPSTVIGGTGYEFQRISDVPAFMDEIYPFLHRTVTKHGLTFQMEMGFHWKLSSDSPDWYRLDDESYIPLPPFSLQIIKVGPRLGWSWRSNCYLRQSCLIYWLDPPPNEDSDDYETFKKDLKNFTRRYGSDFNTYIDHLQPPTEEEYQRLFEE